MNTGHLNHDELIERLYGVGRNPHECAECRRRLQELDARRAEAAPLAEASGDFLAAQRRGIYARLGERPRASTVWAPATVGALCLAAGLIVYHGSPPSAPHAVKQAVSHVAPRAAFTGDSASDDQLLSDVYAMEQSAEPRAAAPIDALIEEN